MDIYIAKDGQPIGPYRPNEIQARLEDSTFDGTELACHEGLDEWVDVKEILKAEDESAPETEETPVEIESADQTDKTALFDLSDPNHKMIESAQINMIINQTAAADVWEFVRALDYPDLCEEFLKGNPLLTKETLEQIKKVLGLIVDGPADEAWQHLELLNNPRIYEWLLKDCWVDVDDGYVKPAEHMEAYGGNCDFFLKLWVHATQEANLGAELKSVTKVSLGYCEISDFTPLKDLTQLTGLHLGGIQISDLTPLKDLSQLKELVLYNNQISDVTPLKDLTQLTSLVLDNNQISDLTPLKDLTQLKSLNLYNNQLTDVKGLEKLTQLTSLVLYNNQISDLTPLKDLTQLKSLNLYNNQLTDVKGLEKLTQLTSLVLFDNKISDVTALNDLTQLTSLVLFENQISDLTPLKDLTQLTNLGLGDNKLTDVKGLEKLTQLTDLGLKNNPDLTKAQIDQLQKALPKCDIYSNPTK